MSVYGGPHSTIDDSLILHLDAGNIASYPGSGNYWYDLSKNNYVSQISGDVPWDNTYGGRFDYPVCNINNFIILPIAAANNTGAYYTQEYWMTLYADASYTRYFSSMATTTDNNFQIFNVTINQNYFTRFGGAGVFTYESGIPFHFVVVRDNSNTGMMYKNGKYIGTMTNMVNISSAEGWVLNQEQDSVLGNFDATQGTTGSFMQVRLYNRALTPEEILNNYNAAKGRYKQ